MNLIEWSVTIVGLFCAVCGVAIWRGGCDIDGIARNIPKGRAEGGVSDTPLTDAAALEAEYLSDDCNREVVRVEDMRKLEAKLTDWTRRTEGGESKLDWLERGERILELEIQLTAANARLVKVLSLTEASEQVESIVDELQSLSATNWQLSARLTAEREEHEAKLAAATGLLTELSVGKDRDNEGAMMFWIHNRNGFTQVSRRIG